MNNSKSSLYSPLSHSFNVDHAEKFGIECAILINHFTFWIEHNQTLKRNFHQGKTWMYQTQEEIAAHYPYWNRDKVQNLLEKLVQFGVIIKGNFNKLKLDKTQWYAFKNEEKFTKVRNRTIESGKSHNAECETAQAIPDTKPTYTKTTTTEEKPERPKKVVVEVSSKEIEDQANEMKVHLDKLVPEHGTKWGIALHVYKSLIGEHGFEYVRDQLNYMLDCERRAKKDELNTFKKNKANPVDKPRSFLINACKDDWALSQHKKKE